MPSAFCPGPLQASAAPRRQAARTACCSGLAQSTTPWKQRESAGAALQLQSTEPCFMLSIWCKIVTCRPTTTTWMEGSVTLTLPSSWVKMGERCGEGGREGGSGAATWLAGCGGGTWWAMNSAPCKERYVVGWEERSMQRASWAGKSAPCKPRKPAAKCSSSPPRGSAAPAKPGGTCQPACSPALAHPQLWRGSPPWAWTRPHSTSRTACGACPGARSWTPARPTPTCSPGLGVAGARKDQCRPAAPGRRDTAAAHCVASKQAASCMQLAPWFLDCFKERRHSRAGCAARSSVRTHRMSGAPSGGGSTELHPLMLPSAPSV